MRFVLLPRDKTGEFRVFDTSKIIEAVYTPKDEPGKPRRLNHGEVQLNCYCGNGSDFEFRGEQATALWDFILSETDTYYKSKP